MDVLGTGDSTVCECPVQCHRMVIGRENNIDKGALKSVVRYILECGSQFSREMQSLRFGIIQTAFDPQIYQSLALWLWPVCVTSQFFLREWS